MPSCCQQGHHFFFYTGACSAWCPVGLLNYVLRTEVIAYLSYSAGVNNLQFYAHSSSWDFVKCCLGTDSAPGICVFIFVFIHVSVFTDTLHDNMLKVPRCLSLVSSGPTPWWHRLWTSVSIHSWRDHEICVSYMMSVTHKFIARSECRSLRKNRKWSVGSYRTVRISRVPHIALEVSLMKQLGLFRIPCACYCRVYRSI
jgi:hypothetical protein